MAFCYSILILFFFTESSHNLRMPLMQMTYINHKSKQKIDKYGMMVVGKGNLDCSAECLANQDYSTSAKVLLLPGYSVSTDSIPGFDHRHGMVSLYINGNAIIKYINSNKSDLYLLKKNLPLINKNQSGKHNGNIKNLGN